MFPGWGIIGANANRKNFGSGISRDRCSCSDEHEPPRGEVRRQVLIGEGDCGGMSGEERKGVRDKWIVGWAMRSGRSKRGPHVLQHASPMLCQKPHRPEEIVEGIEQGGKR